MSQDVLIIGGGPAGIAAGCFLADRGHAVALVDPLGPGGRLVNVDTLVDDPTLPAGRKGWDVAVALGEAALAAGVEIVFGQAEAVQASAEGWQVIVDGAAHHARAVLVATGCRPEPLPGDEHGALAGRGAAYCAVCDGGMYHGQTVVVNGGGDIALAEALTLAESAQQVIVLCPQPALAGSRTRQDAVAARGHVQVVRNARLVELLTNGDGLVRAVVYEHSVDGQRHELACSGVFGAHGELPNSALLANVAALSDEGFVCTDGAYAVAGAPGLFAAGEVRAGAAPYLLAARGEGVGAGFAIDAYLRELIGSPAGTIAPLGE